MAVSFDASSDSHTSTGSSSNESSFGWNATIASGAKGLATLVLSSGNTTDIANSVTANGSSVPAITGGRAVDAAGETGDCKLFFLGTGVPTGTVPMVVNRTNNSTPMRAFTFSVFAAGDTAIYLPGIVLDQGDGTLAERSVDDGSPGANSLRFCGLNSGLPAVPSVGANSTAGPNVSFGARCIASARETTAGQGARSIGFSSGTSDDRAGVYFAVYDLSGGGGGGGNPWYYRAQEAIASMRRSIFLPNLGIITRVPSGGLILPANDPAIARVA